MSDTGMHARRAQLEYSDLQPRMLDERTRRQKAAKIVSVLQHFLGREDLSGLTAVDIGCSTGFIADEIHKRGAAVTGLDIDVPALEKARSRFASESLTFIESSGRVLPFPDESKDVIVFNHVYEHTVDPDEVMAEIRRVLAPQGVVYLGLGNRLGVVEPHYRLPFLSWLPQGPADRYVRATGRADEYYERFRTRSGLRRMCAGLTVWEYTYSILREPERFAAQDMVHGPLAKVPHAVWRLATPIMPIFIWVGSKGRLPQGPALSVPPTRVVG